MCKCMCTHVWFPAVYLSCSLVLFSTLHVSLDTPSVLLSFYYQDIIQALHPMEVADEMVHKALLCQRDYTVMMNAPCDYIKGKIILEKIQQKDVSYLFMFLDILKETGNQDIYNTLIKGSINEMHIGHPVYLCMLCTHVK